MAVTVADLQTQAAGIATALGLDPGIFSRLIGVESHWDPRATSPVGAQGLGQLMPDTARGLGVTDAYDPTQNLQGSARYLRQQLDAFGSYPLALAAYNAGPDAVLKYHGIPPYAETRAYVREVLGSGATPTAPTTGVPGPFGVILGQQGITGKPIPAVPGPLGTIINKQTVPPNATYGDGTTTTKEKAPAPEPMAQIGAFFAAWTQWATDFEAKFTGPQLTVVLFGLGLIVLAVFLAWSSRGEEQVNVTLTPKGTA